jgi:hypothetical protein
MQLLGFTIEGVIVGYGYKTNVLLGMLPVNQSFTFACLFINMGVNFIFPNESPRNLLDYLGERRGISLGGWWSRFPRRRAIDYT